jgi:hypothetical protein
VAIYEDRIHRMQRMVDEAIDEKNEIADQLHKLQSELKKIESFFATEIKRR